MDMDLDSNDTSAMRCDSAGFDTGAAKPKKARKPRAPKVAVAKAAASKTAAKKAASRKALVAQALVSQAVVAQAMAAEPAIGGTASAFTDDVDAGIPVDAVYQRIGTLTRTLHDALRELGYDKELAGTREQLPDARDRLAYIARVTGEAAEKVLNAVDRARTVQEQLTQQAETLRSRWEAVAAYTNNEANRATPAGRALVDETCTFFSNLGGQTGATNQILTDIMMAQDFHDLTGQVIRKVVTLAQSMEEQLVKLLLETTPPEQRKKIESAAPVGSTERLEGPVVQAEGRDDVVSDQAGVDDLLATLGF
jgi:chemotaxis protein CheZ